jgi:hypothetical protein
MTHDVVQIGLLFSALIDNIAQLIFHAFLYNVYEIGSFYQIGYSDHKNYNKKS